MLSKKRRLLGEIKQLSNGDWYVSGGCYNRSVSLSDQAQSDINKAACSAIGVVLFHDIGRRVYLVSCDDGVTTIAQVENDTQRSARTGKGDKAK